MAQKPITATHDGIDITYNETSNKWQFELRGRSRSVDSLADAKAAINKPAPKKSKPFERIEAWHVGYSYSDLTPCEVTSIADADYRGESQVWIVTKKDTRFMSKNERSKVCASEIVPKSPENDAVVAKIAKLREQASKIGEEADGLKRSLPRLEVKAEED